MACRGRVQKTNGVVRLVAEHLIDRTGLPNGLGGRDEAFTLPAGRGDEARHGGGAGLDRREPNAPPIMPRDIFIRDLHINTLNVKAWNFR